MLQEWPRALINTLQHGHVTLQGSSRATWDAKVTQGQGPTLARAKIQLRSRPIEARPGVL